MRYRIRRVIFSLSIVTLTLVALATLPATYPASTQQTTVTITSIATTLTIPGTTTFTISSIATTLTVPGITTVTISSIPTVFIISSSSSTSISSISSSSSSSSSVSSISSSSSISAPAPDFTMGATSAVINLAQSSSGTSTILVGSANGFSAAVALSYSWIGTAPSDVSITLPGPVTPLPGSTATSMLTVSAGSTASTGSFTLSITGTSGSLMHSTDIAVVISAASATSVATTTSTPPPSGCAFATAISGSELAPLAQTLRGFRDNSIQKTRAGSQFMVAFNAWYYSFSPYIAYYIASHPLERTMLKDLSYPLVGILYAAYYSYALVAPLSTEAAAVVAGIVAALLIGLVYVAPICCLMTRLVRRHKRALILRRLHAIPSSLWFAGSVVMIGIAYWSGFGVLMAIGTANLTLSALSFGSLLGIMAFMRVQFPTNQAVLFAIRGLKNQALSEHPFRHRA